MTSTKPGAATPRDPLASLRALGLALGLAATVAPVWLTHFLPMVDLPQHAAQVATWHRWQAPGFDYAALWEVNYRTPYLLSRSLAFALSHVVSVLDAYRVLVSLSLVGIPLATLWLLRAAGGSPWWALATLPLGYGLAFNWGFVAFGLATPLGLAYLAFVWRSPVPLGRRRAIGLWLATQFLFFAHVFVFGWAGLTAAAVLGLRARRWRDRLHAWLPLLAALPLAVLWIVATRGAEARAAEAMVGRWSLLRLAQPFPFAVGVEQPDPLAIVLGLALFALPLLLGGRPSRRLVRWAPFAVTLAVFLAAPLSVFGTAFVYPRFAVFLLPTWLLALERSTDKTASDEKNTADETGAAKARRLGRLLLVGLVAAVLLDIGLRLDRFDDEVGGFAQLIDAMEPNRRVLYLPLDRASEVVDQAAYLHFGQWYQVEKGGIVDFSFAMYFPNLFRYQPGVEPPLPRNINWSPWLFDYHRHGGAAYDYILVRSRAHDPWLILFDEAQAELEPVARAGGGWWLYRRRGS